MAELDVKPFGPVHAMVVRFEPDTVRAIAPFSQITGVAVDTVTVAALTEIVVEAVDTQPAAEVTVTV